MFNIKLKKRVSHPPFLRKSVCSVSERKCRKKRGRLRNSWTLKHSKSENIWTELFAVEEYRHVQVMLPSSLNQNSPWISPFSQSEAFFLLQLFFFRILKWESIPFAKTSTKWSEFKVEIFSDEWNSRFWFHSLLSPPPQQSSWGWCFCRPLTSLGKMKHNITKIFPSFHLVFHDFSCLLSFSSFRFSSHWISNFPDLTFVSPSLYLNMLLPYMFLTLVSTWRTWRRDTSKSCAFQDALFFFGVKLLWHSLPK